MTIGSRLCEGETWTAVGCKETEGLVGFVVIVGCEVDGFVDKDIRVGDEDQGGKWSSIQCWIHKRISRQLWYGQFNACDNIIALEVGHWSQSPYHYSFWKLLGQSLLNHNVTEVSGPKKKKKKKKRCFDLPDSMRTEYIQSRYSQSSSKPWSCRLMLTFFKDWSKRREAEHLWYYWQSDSQCSNSVGHSLRLE